MRELLDSSFELYKIKVQRYLDFPHSTSLEKLVEDIKAAAFMQEITDREAEYLLNLLPLDIDDFDDNYEHKEINRKTGGINYGNIGPNQGIRKHVRDELDDFEEEEEKEESGFGNFAAYKHKKSEYDELDDFEEYDDEENESGFASFGNYKQKSKELDDLDDFEEEDEDEGSSGFFSLL